MVFRLANREIGLRADVEELYAERMLFITFIEKKHIGMDSTSFLILATILLAIILVVFLLIRALVLWYFKIDVLVNLMKDQNEYLKRIYENNNTNR